MLKKRFGSFLLTIGLAALFLFVISLQGRNDAANTGMNFNLLLIGLAASTAAYFLLKGALSESSEMESPGRFKTVKRMAAIRKGEIPKPERKKRKKKKKKGEEEEDEDEDDGDGENDKEKKSD